METLGSDEAAHSNRKRNRSVECSFVGQSKQFVNENIVNKRDEAKMKEIYNKTMSLLFKGASHHFQQIDLDHGDPKGSPSATLNLGDPTATTPAVSINDRDRLKLVQLLGGGECRPLNGCKKSDVIPAAPDRRCLCCARESRLHGDCSSCGQEMCEHCGFTCLDCNEPLCSKCVTLFDCGTADNPCCSRCQLFI